LSDDRNVHDHLGESIVIDRLKRFLSGGSFGGETPGSGPGGEASGEDLRLAMCVLLLELAWADEEFSEEERTHVLGVIQRHIGLDDAEAADLLERAEKERSQAVDLWRFAHVIRENYSIGQKLVLAETMWGLVYSDGVLSSHEGYLLRKMSKLLDLKIGYLSEAKRRWEENSSPGID
jgi:uncharacterized tellurite resistance protein B-like protein